MIALFNVSTLARVIPAGPKKPHQLTISYVDKPDSRMVGIWGRIDARTLLVTASPLSWPDPTTPAAVGIVEDRHARDRRRDLRQHPQPFAGYRRVEIAEAGDGAAGVRETCDEASTDRVGEG